MAVWLKAHGVNARKPLHALRKEYCSLVNARYDLVTAKECLRHSSVAITAAHYIENRKRGVTGLGAVLAGSEQAFLPTLKNTEPDQIMNYDDNYVTGMEDLKEYLQKPEPEFSTLQFRFAKKMTHIPHAYVVRTRRTRTNTPSCSTGSARRASGKSGRTDTATSICISAGSSTGG